MRLCFVGFAGAAPVVLALRFRLGRETAQVRAPSRWRRAAAQLKAAQHHVGDEREDEEDEEHPGDALHRLDDGPVDFEDPAVGVEFEDLFGGVLRADVAVERVNADTARDADDVDGEGDITAPGRGEFLRDKAGHDAADGAVEDAADEEADSGGNGEGDEQEPDEHGRTSG